MDDELPETVKKCLDVLEEIDSFPCKFNKSIGKFDIDFEHIENRLYMKPIFKVRKTSLGQYIYGKMTVGEIIKKVTKLNEKIEKDYEKIPPIDTFKGKPLLLKVEEFEFDGKQSEIRPVAHPDITKYVREELIRKMNYYFTKNYGK